MAMGKRCAVPPPLGVYPNLPNTPVLWLSLHERALTGCQGSSYVVNSAQVATLEPHSAAFSSTVSSTGSRLLQNFKLYKV